MNDVQFYIIDCVIVLILLRIDWHLRCISRNTRKDNRDLFKK
jgi:hypothetical protein